jgi:hypothetical protein
MGARHHGRRLLHDQGQSFGHYLGAYVGASAGSFNLPAADLPLSEAQFRTSLVARSS